VTQLDHVYTARFDDASRRAKMGVWRELGRFLQRWIDPGQPVLDVGCDAGYFIGNVRARERWATDLRDVRSVLPPDVQFRQADGLSLTDLLPGGTFGTVFMSNYLEHLRDSDAVVRQIQVARDLLAPGGRLIVLQPNIRLIGGRYWDFIDHHVPLTEASLIEAAELAGLRTVHLVTRFLPYTTKSRLPMHRSLVRLYLRFPPAWWLLGKQTLYVAERPS
jgi:SAM-dependent methyltransferase